MSIKNNFATEYKPYFKKIAKKISVQYVNYNTMVENNEVQTTV